MSRKDKGQKSGVTWAQTVRDVLVASINKGQFPLALFGLLFCLLILKMPQEDVSKLVFMILDWFHNYEMIGYMLFIVSTSGWFFHVKWQRRIISGEISRISEERTSIQKLKLGNLIKSSKDPQ